MASVFLGKPSKNIVDFMFDELFTYVQYNDQTEKWLRIEGELTSDSIPNKQDAIKVRIGRYVTSISNSAFENCSRLTNVTILNSVTSIGESAFIGCSSLTSVIFDGNAPTVDANAFNGVASGCKAIVDPIKTGWPAEGTTWNGLVVEHKATSN